MAGLADAVGKGLYFGGIFLLQNILSEDAVLLCAFVLVTVLVGSLCKGKLGVLIGSLSGLFLGVIEISLSAFVNSGKLFSLANVPVPVCLCATGLVVSLFATKKKAQKTVIYDQNAQLSEINRKYSDFVTDYNIDDIFNNGF